MQAKYFELRVDGVPYEMRVTPFVFNNEIRFYVSYNGSEEFVFAWDPDLKRHTPIGDEAAQIPASLEEAIAGRLGAVESM
ncbi:MAG TPA: hypothetical protein VIK74_02575 [Parasegetibacter sp.]